MTKKKWTLLNYSVPLVALLIVASQFFLVNTTKLNKWKGGGFGMYSELHYYYNDLVISNLKKPLDSIILQDRSVATFVMDVKRQPNNSNLKHMAQLISKYAINDTIKLQLWKPVIDSKNSKYTRELVNEYQFIKP